MTVGNGHDAERTAVQPWYIVSVVDPEGRGRGCGYTVGLTALGRPELHLWSHPTDGEDPGEDWAFDPCDLQALLSDIAPEALSGQLTAGDRFAELFDDGVTTVRFLVGHLTTARALDAHQLAPETPVLPLRWSLHRPALGSARPLEPPVASRIQRLAAATYRETVRMHADVLARARSAGEPPGEPIPAVWRCPPPGPRGMWVEVGLEQRFGPLHSFVLARGEQLLRADAMLLRGFLDELFLAAQAGADPLLIMAKLSALARPVGRSNAVAEALRAASEICGLLVGDGHGGRWSEVMRRWVPTAVGEEARSWREASTVLLRAGLNALLAAEVLADILSPADLAWSRGPWLWTVSGGQPPGQPWVASRSVRWQAQAWLREVPGGRLSSAGRELSGAVARDEQVRDAAQLLRGWRTTGPGSLPAHLPLPLAPEQFLGLPGGALPALRCTVDTVVAMLAFADRLSGAQWTAMSRPLREALPALSDHPPRPGGTLPRRRARR